MGLAALAKQMKKIDKDVNKPLGAQLIADMDTFLVAREQERANKRESRLAVRPSSFGSCIRKQWYFLTEAPRKVSMKGRNVRILNIGTVHHEYTQNEILIPMAEQGIIELTPPQELVVPDGVEIVLQHQSADTEVKFLDSRKSVQVSGMVDGAFTYKGIDLLWEYKTMNPNQFESLAEPLPEHIMQGALYAYCLNRRNVLFHYENKGTQDYKAFLVEYGDRQVEWVGERLDKIIEYVESKETPKAEKSFKCSYCDYAHICDKGDTKA